jgi:thiol-disulfide isomerase/thioredoxin
MFECQGAREDSSGLEETLPVNFHATWRPPRQCLAPLLAEMARSYEGRFLFAQVDVEPALSERFKIKSMSTVLSFRDGKVVAYRQHAVRFVVAQNGVTPPNDAAVASRSAAPSTVPLDR